MTLQTIADFSTAVGESRWCVGWEVLAWAHQVLDLLFFPLEKTATEDQYWVISNNLIVLKHCFLSPCLVLFFPLALRHGFQTCSKVVQKQLNHNGTEWWGLGFQRDAENTVALIEADWDHQSFSPDIRSSKGTRSLTLPTSGLPDSEISASLCFVVSPPHSQF